MISHKIDPKRTLANLAAKVRIEPKLAPPEIIGKGRGPFYQAGLRPDMTHEDVGAHMPSASVSWLSK